MWSPRVHDTLQHEPAHKTAAEADAPLCHSCEYAQRMQNEAVEQKHLWIMHLSCVHRSSAPHDEKHRPADAAMPHVYLQGIGLHH